MTKKSKDIVITTALRTAIGKYEGIWKKFEAHDLGAAVIKKILNKSKIEAKSIDEVIMGQVLTGETGQNPARHEAINTGIPKEKTGYLFKNKDSKDLADSIAMVMQKDYNSLKSVGFEGRKNVLKKFDVDKMCQSTFTEYKKLIQLS